MVVAKLERANSRPITYERGLIPAFKAVISYWMLYWLLISPVVLIFTGNPGVLARWQYASLIGIQAIALGLLFWRAGKYYLKQVYLPLILTITSLSFVVEKVWFPCLGTLPGASRGELLHAFAVRQDFALLLL
ncbi:MAG: hypothetical protein KC422_20030, partial [Trueperaceae bacterium]|nr:hypothetical protein [Trueperaceae bacterium]